MWVGGVEGMGCGSWRWGRGGWCGWSGGSEMEGGWVGIERLDDGLG